MNTTPQHIAFIMDGNSTWAKRENKTTMDGYLAGMQNMSRVVLWANARGIRFATFYAFSKENWERPAKWVAKFMDLALEFFKNDKSIQEVLAVNPKIVVAGNIKMLPCKLQKVLTDCVEKTRGNQGIVVCLAISYGGRDEIVRAAQKVSELGLSFTEDTISQNLDTSDIPDPELIIRTGGQQRLSNFLLWQSSYAELYFSRAHWPEFDDSELGRAITDFCGRRRSYGR